MKPLCFQTAKHPLHVQHDHADPVLARVDRSLSDGAQLVVLHDGARLQVCTVLPHHEHDTVEACASRACAIREGGEYTRFQLVLYACGEAGLVSRTFARIVIILTHIDYLVVSAIGDEKVWRDAGYKRCH